MYKVLKYSELFQQKRPKQRLLNLINLSNL